MMIRRRAPWVLAALLVLIAAASGLTLAQDGPFAQGGAALVALLGGNSDPDGLDPWVSALVVTPEQVMAGGLVTITVKLEDPLVRITAVGAEVRGPSSGQTGRVPAMVYDPDTGEWVGRFEVPALALPGRWEVFSVSFTDDEGGLHAAPDITPASFAVLQPAPPNSMSLGSITVSDADAITGLPAMVSLALEDSAGLASVEVVVVSPSGRQRAAAGAMINPPSGGPLPTSLPVDLSLRLPDGSEPGRWSVLRVTVTNGLGLTGTFFPGPSAGMNVTSSGEDVTPPEIVDVQLSSDTVVTGSQVTVTAAVTDTPAGVGNVVAYLTSPDRSVSLAARLTPTQDGRWTGGLGIPYYASGGPWVCTVRAVDRVGNDTGMDLSGPQAVLDVRPGYEPADVPSPSLSDFDLSGSGRGGPLTARFTVSDNGVGISRVTVLFEAPGGRLVEVPAVPGDSLGTWFCSLGIPEHAPSGAWRAATVKVTDAMGRPSELDLTPARLHAPGADQVQLEPADREDTTPPVLESGPAVEIVSGRVMFRAAVSDDLSGVESVLVLLSAEGRPAEGASPLSGRMTLYLRYSPDTGLWEGGLPTRSFAEKGEWSVTGLVLTDRAGNSRALTSGLDFDSRFFEIQ